jgi:hypothetical protein
MTPSDTAISEAPLDQTSVAAEPAPETPAPASTPEERAKQFQAFMAKVMGDMSRMRNQVDYTARHFHGEIVEIHGRLDYLEGVLAMICDGLHIPMPKRQPKLIDAQVELVAELNEGEVCEFRAAYTAAKHPIHGHYQIIIGDGNEVQQANPSQFHPIVTQKLDEAFVALRQTEGFVDGQFYYVRLGLIHAQPIDATSVPFAVGATVVADAPAANDDAVSTAEHGDVQSE